MPGGVLEGALDEWSSLTQESQEKKEGWTMAEAKETQEPKESFLERTQESNLELILERR